MHAYSMRRACRRTCVRVYIHVTHALMMCGCMCILYGDRRDRAIFDIVLTLYPDMSHICPHVSSLHPRMCSRRYSDNSGSCSPATPPLRVVCEADALSLPIAAAGEGRCTTVYCRRGGTARCAIPTSAKDCVRASLCPAIQQCKLPSTP